MRISTLLFSSVMALTVPGFAVAQAITDCDWVGNPANIMEPWEVHSRTYANGNIRVAWLDTGGEPVCCSSHLLILSPSGDGEGEPIYRQCRVASAQPGQGFYSVDVPGITASYDPNKGLLLSVPIGHWHPGMDTGAPAIPDRMEIRINQANGVVVFE